MIVYSNGGEGGGGIKLKVTRKYWENCRIHARMRKKIKTNETFCSKSVKRLIASRRLNLIEVVHFTSVPA